MAKHLRFSPILRTRAFTEGAFLRHSGPGARDRAGAISIWSETAGIALISLALLGLPAFTGIAIVRYRLYEIDLIINRTLVYGVLTGTLALVYFGGVAATQTIFRALTGQEQ
jgi:hypothetical protein